MIAKDHDADSDDKVFILISFKLQRLIIAYAYASGRLLMSLNSKANVRL